MEEWTVVRERGENMENIGLPLRAGEQGVCCKMGRERALLVAWGQRLEW